MLDPKQSKVRIYIYMYILSHRTHHMDLGSNLVSILFNEHNNKCCMTSQKPFYYLNSAVVGMLDEQ